MTDDWQGTHDWGALTRAQIAAARDAGALPVLTVGSVEQHADHLPVDTDTLSAYRMALAAAQRCPAPHVLVLPPPSFGFSPHHRAWAGTITLSLETFVGLVTDVAESLQRTGFKRLLIVNGHGGNIAALSRAVGRLRFEGRDVAWCPCVVAGGDAHAGHAETSVLLHISPAEVLTDQWRAGNGAPLPDLLPSMRRGGVAAVSEVGVLGDPTTATAAEGERMLAEMVDDCLRRIGRWAPAADGMLT